MRSTIASAAKALESSVHVTIRRGGSGQTTEVDFSIEVGEVVDGCVIVERLTDPSLVEAIAKTVSVDAANISVEAQATALDEVLLTLGWRFPAWQTGVDYLDGSCLVYAEDRLLETIDYRGAQGIHGERASSAAGWSVGRGEEAAVVHSGDVMSTNGGQHAIRLHLSRLPLEATDCMFVLSAYNCGDLSRFISPSMRIFSAQCPGHSLCSYAVSDAGSASAVVVCALTRERNKWTVVAHSQTSAGTVRDYTPIEAAIGPIQERHVRRCRRMPYVRLYELWNTDRVLPRGMLNDGDREDLLLPLLDLNPGVFRCIMEYV
jgi:stress response protein SCP2